MSWRLANSLVALREQVNAMAPGRSTASDGTIGDQSHATRPSRHNPNGAGVVCALDITDDPAGGCPVHDLAEQVRANPHPDLAYVISARRIAGRSTGWNWHEYTGANPHIQHAHFGVGEGPDASPAQPYDDTQAWPIAGSPGGNGNAAVNIETPRTLRKGSSGEDVRGLQLVLIGASLLAPGGADGVFGPVTEAAVREFQGVLGVAQDGVVGPKTHAAISNLLAFLAAGGGQ
jgi:hypothetical protein